MSGFCLSSFYTTIDPESKEKYEAILIILGSENDAMRFKETEFLLN